MQARNQIILSPFFLDQPLPGLAERFSAEAELNAPSLRGGDAQERMSVYHRELANRVHQAVTSGARPVSICGDCCATIPVLAGLQRAGIAPTLVWFDAHGDFNTPEISPSGFLGGMPLAMIVGRGEQRMLHAVGLSPIPESRVLLCDARDLDPKETVAVRASSIRHVRSIGDVISESPATGPLYVHFDCDVISSDEAPAQNYPVASGPGSEQVAEIFKRLNNTGRVVAASLSAWNPDLDKTSATARTITPVFDALIHQR